MAMRIHCSVLGISVTIFSLFLVPMVYSWIYDLSATIHKNYMFLLCNGLLVFICLNSRSICGFSPGKYHGEQHTGKSGDEGPQVAGSGEGRPPDGSRRVGEVEDEKETEDGSLYAVEVRENGSVTTADEDKEVDQTLFVIVEETHDDELEEGVAAGEDDKTLSVVEETRDDELKIEEGEEDQQEQEGGTDTISLEELNKKCEEFIRRMKKEIRFESPTVLCY